MQVCFDLVGLEMVDYGSEESGVVDFNVFLSLR
jgi:hypothetical protein